MKVLPELKFRMKPDIACLLILLLFAIGCAGKEATRTDDAGITDPPAIERKADLSRRSVDRARDAVLDYFAPARGTVEYVEGGSVRVRFEKDHQIKKGMRLSVFREGEPFYHPVTKELIGNAEDYIGRIEVGEEETEDGLYQGTVLNGDIQAGDRARIGSAGIKLAFFQSSKADWSTSEAFYASLRDSGRFDLYEAYTPDYQAVTISKIARDLGAEAVLMFSTPVRDGKIFMNVKLYWAEDAGMIGEVEELYQSVAEITTPDEEFIESSFNETTPWRRFMLPGGRLLAMGDVDGNGSVELAVSDGRDIRIYSVEEEFRELWRIMAEGEGSHLSLDMLDLNGNGKAEIFVTSAVNAGVVQTDDNELPADNLRLNSYVLEYDPSEGYRKIEQNMPFFLRVTGKTLLMQRFDRFKIFGGPVFKGEWSEMHFVPGDAVNLPNIANIYGFVFVDWGNEGRPDLVTFDEHAYLYVFDYNGNLQWKSDASYGPFTLSFETRTASVITPVVKWSVRGRLEVIRTDRGQEVVAVRRKPLLSAVPGLGAYKAEVNSLRWNGGEMEEKVVLSEVSGSVTDYLIYGREMFLVAGRDLFAFMRDVTEGEFSTGNILYYYKFGNPESSHEN